MLISFTHKEKQFINVNTNDDWSVFNISDAEKQKIIFDIKWQEVKKERQLLLYKTDWTQGKDTPLAAEKVTAFATYRQALRDIPQNIGNPDDVLWPVSPTI